MPWIWTGKVSTSISSAHLVTKLIGLENIDLVLNDLTIELSQLKEENINAKSELESAKHKEHSEQIKIAFVKTEIDSLKQVIAQSKTGKYSIIISFIDSSIQFRCWSIDSIIDWKDERKLRIKDDSTSFRQWIVWCKSISYVYDVLTFHLVKKTM